MSIKITNTDELVQALRDLETFERYNLYPDTVRRIREAITKYERNRDDARVAEIAAGLSDKAKARLEWINTRDDTFDRVIAEELESKGLEHKAVLAELQKRTPPPERWGVFRDDTGEMLCKCCEKPDAVDVAKALCDYLNAFYSVRKL